MSTSTKAKPNTEMASWSQFEGEIRSRDAEIATLLPSHISKEKFVWACWTKLRTFKDSDLGT